MPRLFICYKNVIVSFHLLIYINRRSFPHFPAQANISTSQQSLVTPDVLQSPAEHELLQLTFELAKL